MVAVVSIKGDFKKAGRYLDKMHRRQIPFATSLAINRTANRIKAFEKRRIKVDIEFPTSPVVNSIRVKPSTKRNLVGKVFIIPAIASFMRYAIEGGTRGPRGSVEFIPVNLRLNRQGNIPGRRTGKVGKLIDKPNTFVATINGTTGLWQRGRGRRRNKELKLIGFYGNRTRYSKRFPFYRYAQRTTNSHWKREFNKAIARALKTAR